MLKLNFLHRNWSLKVGAFVLGLVLWTHVKTDQRYEHVVKMPLSVSEASGRFVVANEIPKDVEVIVTGSGKDLIFGSRRGEVVLRPRIARREAVTVDLGLQDVEGIDPEDDFELIGIKSPRSLVLDFDYLDTRELPVSSRVGIELDAGYTIVGAIHIDPPTVRIGGPRQYVRQIDSVLTDSLLLRGISQNVSIQVPVDLPEGWNITATPEEVNVSANVQVLLERRLRDIPIKVTHVPRRVTAGVIPETVTIDVVGGAEVVSNLQPVDVRAELDYRQRFEHGLDDLPIDVTLPRDVRLLRVIPKTASLMLNEGRGR